MQIFLLILLIVLAVVVIRGLFNKEWRDASQAKIDAVKKERIFWGLVNGYRGMNLGVEAIFTVHLDVRHLATFITSGNARSEEDEKILKLLKGQSSFSSIKVLNDTLEEIDKVIAGIFSHDDQLYTKGEIKKLLEGRKNEQLFVPAQYDKFVDFYMRFLPDHAHLKSADLWEARKKLNDAAGKLEWKTDEIKVDAETLFAVRKSEVEVGEAVGEVICGKDNEKDILKAFIRDWEHIQMLRTCVVDLVVPWQGTNLLDRWFWRIVEIFL